MVTVTNYLQRETAEGKQFFVLEISGDVEFVVSETTGKSYATIRKVSIPATFDETICKSLIGKQMPGTIQKVKTDPYEFLVKKTGDQVTLDYVYEYSPTDATQTMEQAVFQS